jgi:hypothetical protein
VRHAIQGLSLGKVYLSLALSGLTLARASFAFAGRPCPFIYGRHSLYWEVTFLDTVFPDAPPETAAESVHLPPNA